MRRVLSTAVLLGLLVFTAAAFAVTERLKLVKSPVYGTFVSKTLSPVCGCARGKAVVSFKLRRSDDVTLTIVDRRRNVVATLADAEPLPRGQARFVWRGRTDEELRAPDGVYQPEIHLAQAHRTILMPNLIRLDTQPPKVVSVEASRETISPDGDGVGGWTKLRYRLSEPAHVTVFLDGERLIFGRFQKPHDSVNWNGKGADGRPLTAGTYLLHVGAVDLAGNVTRIAARKPVLIRVRYIAVLPAKLGVRPGARIAVRVDTDAPRYWWKLAGRHGVVKKPKTPVLRLPAPRKPGAYTLLVGEGRYTARARVIVVGR